MGQKAIDFFFFFFFQFFFRCFNQSVVVLHAYYRFQVLTLFVALVLLPGSRSTATSGLYIKTTVRICAIRDSLLHSTPEGRERLFGVSFFLFLFLELGCGLGSSRPSSWKGLPCFEDCCCLSNIHIYLIHPSKQNQHTKTLSFLRRDVLWVIRAEQPIKKLRAAREQEN